ncbi:phospholipase effector Tle1 domain-containing protein [Chromobacterium vaccinii]|uniref:phospholipase effector Tle1 domain-containing protein n=1 Tax=Chromobacterium vaccinii TaxID=1108595 RepID=UPI003C71E0CF
MSLQNSTAPSQGESKAQKAARFEIKAKLTNSNCKTQPSCKHNIWTTFFFDGTNNNLDRDLKTPTEKGKKRYLCDHSNIVSLYEAAILDVPTLRYTFYMQGVGTIFSQIGEEEASDAGLSMAAGGQARLSYAYYQLCNAIRMSFDKPPLFTSDDFKKELKVSKDRNPNPRLPDLSSLETIQKKLALDIGNNKNTPKIEIVNIAVFGFSRGAALARAFCRWLELSCKRQGDTWLFAGCVPIRLYFLGIFDTVASVGLAHSTPGLGRAPGRSANGVVDGQNSWATPDMLKVTSFTKQCRHYVAAHEVRYSFPLTSIRHEDGSMPLNAVEVVYPGSHSDVGGGYGPGDQGKAVGHRRKLLSQIALLNMYNDAKNAGVPLRSLSALQTEPAGQDFEIDPLLIKRFNAYMAWASAGGRIVEDALYAHLKKYWHWRIATSPKFMQQDCIQQLSKGSTLRSSRSDKQDLEDMHASEKDWQGDLSRARIVQSEVNEAAELLRLQSEEAKKPVPKDVHDFFDQHLHDSHASFYMIGPTTAWQRQQRIADARYKSKSVIYNPTTGLTPKKLSPFEQKLVKCAPGDSSDPKKIDSSNYPVVTDSDYSDLVKGDGAGGRVASAMTNTRREIGGHAHQRATFVGRYERYAKTSSSIDFLARDTLKGRQDQLAHDYKEQVRIRNLAFENQKTILRGQGLPTDKLEQAHQQDMLQLGVTFRQQIQSL